jgi:multiple sugar transport system ATP-binding protein
MRTEVARLQDSLNVTTVYVTHDQTEAMTLGDRVAVMSDGVLQQYAPPRTLYSHPRNLFVAGFIGSPAMNLLQGTLADGGIQTVLGRIPLGDELRRRLEAGEAAREVVVGFRPEHLEDAALPAVAGRSDGLRFDVELDVVESVGSDVFAYFGVRDGGPGLAARAGAKDEGHIHLKSGERELVARLDGASMIDKGRATLWMDTTRVHVFSPQTGENLAETVALAS